MLYQESSLIGCQLVALVADGVVGVESDNAFLETGSQAKLSQLRFHGVLKLFKRSSGDGHTLRGHIARSGVVWTRELVEESEAK